MRSLLIALGFYTRYPVPAITFDSSEFAKSVVFLPLVGLLVAVPLVVFGIFAQKWLPYSLVVTFIIGFSIFLTGALHEDGLGDFFDGFWGGFTREKTLEIMKDSRVGIFGLLAVIGVLTLRFQILVHLEPMRMLSTVFIGQVMSRTLILPYFLWLPYARPQKTVAASLVDKPPDKRAVMMAILLGLASLFPLGLNRALLLLCTSMALMFMLGLWWKHRIGGYTGDCLGAAQQLQLVLIDLIVLLCH